jgi:hypothetical protein
LFRIPEEARQRRDARTLRSVLLLDRAPPLLTQAAARICLRQWGKLMRQYAENALTDTSDNVYFEAFDSAGELQMNDAMTAETTTEEISTEAQDFVEMGSVSEETKGSWAGDWPDGGGGKFGG